MNTRLLIIHARSPLHAGTGQSFGAVDLAIARDRATDHPYVPGSSIKGSLRSLAFARAGADAAIMGRATALFGPAGAHAADHAGTLAVGDANLLLLPVRSVWGTFAWVTSPLLLARFMRDARDAGVELPASLPVGPTMEGCHISSASALRQGKKVLFEDLDFEPTKEDVSEWATALAKLIFGDDDFWSGYFTKHFCVVHDDVMSFLSQYATDIVTRNVLKPDTKTVDNLWDEENLPTESILYSLLLATPNRGAERKWQLRKVRLTAEDIFAELAIDLGQMVQLGGKATIGRGRCQLSLRGGQR